MYYAIIHIMKGVQQRLQLYSKNVMLCRDHKCSQFAQKCQCPYQHLKVFESFRYLPLLGHAVQICFCFLHCQLFESLLSELTKYIP